MIKFFKRFVLMLQFLTTIPIPLSLNVDDEDFGKGLAFAPLVGLVLGGILAAAAALLGQLFSSHFLIAVIVLILYILLTGGIHLDGLGDTFDGLFSNRPKERILEIMRDSRVGTNAVLAIISVLLLNTVTYGSIPRYQSLCILLMPVAGRIGSLVGAGISKYAREGQGLGKPFINVCGTREVLTGLILALIIFSSLLSIKGLILFVSAIASTLLFTRIFSAKIDGMTGDTLGAVCELNQTVYLLMFYVLFVK